MASVMKLFVIICGLLMICSKEFSVQGSPIINIRKLYDAASEVRIKTDRPFLKADTDVLQLEHLQHKPIFDDEQTDDIDDDDDSAGFLDTNADNIPPSHSRASIDNAFEESMNTDDILPTLEKQLEAEAAKVINSDGGGDTESVAATPAASSSSGQLEKEEDMIIQHRPPATPTKINTKLEDTDNISVGQNNAGQEQLNPPEIPDINEKSTPAKSFYGAARLAFGQNPEVLPTLSTTTTTTTQTAVHGSHLIPSEILTNIHNNNNPATDGSIVLTEIVVSSPPPSDEHDDEFMSAIGTNTPIETHHQHNNNNNNNKERIEEDSIVAELEATKANVERRSVDRIPPKTAESLLKHAESSFDMAQYVFWTGDEAGVARAVEEFIQQGLMSRENALKFLREIRMGIDYLQKSYDNRVLLERKSNDFKKNDQHSINKSTKQPTLISSNVLSDGNHFNQHKQQHHETAALKTTMPHSSPAIDRDNLSINSNLQKTLDQIPSLARLQDIGTLNNNVAHNKDNNNNNDDDDISGRARLADFLYTEYSLEEIVYQLAKVMFSQSLTHGSEQSQKALQRLTSFLETEGELGRISPSLQKKILDVLLAALSDTLANHPELLAAARANLGKAFHQVQHNSIESLKQ